MRRKSFSKDQREEDDPNKGEDEHPYRIGRHHPMILVMVDGGGGWVPIHLRGSYSYY